MELVKVSINKEFIFRKIKDHFDINKIIIPSYSFLCKIISQSLIKEQSRINNLIKRHLDKHQIEKLYQFLVSEIPKLKAEMKDFSLKEIQKEIAKVILLRDLLLDVENLVDRLRISAEGVKYYASLISHYQDYRLKKLQKNKVIVYLCCYIYVEFKKINDNLILAFIHHVSQISTQAKTYAKEEIYKNSESNRSALKGLPDILKIVLDEKNADKKFRKIQKSIYQVVPKEKLQSLRCYLSQKNLDTYKLEWGSIGSSYFKYSRYLRPILKNIEFESSLKENPLRHAIVFLKKALFEKKWPEQKDSAPLKLIPKHIRQYILEEGKVLHDRYEFFLYRSIKNGLESGEIFINQSLSYKSFEKDLITLEDWRKRKSIIKSLDLEILKRPIEKTINELEKELHNRIESINTRIKNNENPYVKIVKKHEETKWSLKYESNHNDRYTTVLFNENAQIGIGDLLMDVDYKCHFTKAFDHILSNGVRSINREAIIACIISFGTNLGLYRMSQISNLTYRELADTSQNYINEDGLRRANDIIADEISKLPVFGHFNLEDGHIHSSSDGQKFEVQGDSINTRYSSKYFGLGKGISCYSLVANHVPINAKIIGANEYEGHYVLDLIYNNSTQIRPRFHSTDTHGVNQVNFALLDIFGYQFAPRYRKLSNKKIYSFRHPTDYEELLIKPFKALDRKLIESEWDNIQKIILSLERKSCTQAIIVQKLSSYKRQNKTKMALWEYNKAIESLYILNYLDDIYLRKNVQKALNTGESFHQLKRAVAFANNGKIKAKTERDQTIWSESCRLIANSIIYYNCLILTEVLTVRSSEFLNGLKNRSPVAWNHINFYGNYEFKKKKPKLRLSEWANNISPFSEEFK